MSEPEVLTDYVNKCETCAYANDKSAARCVACGEPIFAWVEATWHSQQRLEATIAADRKRIEAAEDIIGSLIDELRRRAHVVIYSDQKLEAYGRDYPEEPK